MKDFILQLIQILIWPSIVVFVILLFRSNLAGLLDRLKLFKGPVGIEIQIEKMKEAQKKASEDAEKVSQKVLDEQKQSLYVFKQESRKNKQAAPAKVSSENDQKSKELEFERIYNIIFGSQLRLLEITHEKEKITILELEAFYDELKKDYPVFQTWTLEEYMRFLYSLKLVEKVEEAIKLTKKGIDFINYVTSAGYTNFKIV